MPLKPIAQGKTAVRDTMKAFEKALKNSTNDDGSVDMKALKAEAKKVKSDPDLKAVFAKSIDVLEKSFVKRRTVQGSCGSSIVREAPKELSAKQAKSVFAALIEAKSKGLDKVDADGDGKISPTEAKKRIGSELSDKLASAAARGATHAAPVRKPSTGGGGGGGGGTVGC